MATIPVDMFKIVNGPRAMYCRGVELSLEELVYVPVMFTLTTAASASKFQRELDVRSLTGSGNEYTFTAVFCGKIVSGLYNCRTRKGWFNLD
ncbi:MAG: hypothetical protein WBP22_00040 [Candidatus Saccharimonas sp.]